MSVIVPRFASQLARTRQPARTVDFTKPQTIHDVRQHLYRKQHGSAVVSFKKQLGISDSSYLEKCILQFGFYEAPERMLEAFQSFIRAGYSASAKLWTSILQVSSIKPEELGQLAKDSKPTSIDEKLVAALIRYHALAGRPDVAEEVFARYEQVLQSERADVLPGPLIWKSLINARGVVGDLVGAKRWFDVWRTSKAHPYGFMEDAEVQQPIKLRSPTSASRSMGIIGLLTAPTRTSISRSALREVPRSTHSMVEVPAPDAQPYMALLRHIVDYTPKNASLSLDMLDLMAADRVPLSTSVMNALIYHEQARGEAMSTESVLALYEKMREEKVNGAVSPDGKTFERVFGSYKEPKRELGRRHNPPSPTQLARRNGSATPAACLLDNPRLVFQDMMGWHRICRKRGEPGIDTALLDTALKAFIKTRDFVGAKIVLLTYKLLHVEPSSRTHALVIMGVWRAFKRQEAFQSRRGKDWLTRDKLEELTQRVQSLNELAGYDPHPATEVVQIEPALPSSTVTDSFLLSNRPVQGIPSPLLWNGRKIPRTKYELRKTRKFELRDLQDLQILLWMASPLCSMDNQAWARELKLAESEMWLEWEARW